MLLVWLCCFLVAHGWMPDYGNYSLKISASWKVQELFDEALRLEFGFGQTLARDYFNQSQTLDKDCAMCYWGLALANGPYLNHPIVVDNAQLQTAYDAAQSAVSALKRRPQVSTKEQLLVSAMAVRYPPSVSGNQTETYLSYVAKMKDAHAALPNDADIAVLLADSLMILDCDSAGYNFYDPATGEPYPNEVAAGALLKPHLGTNRPEGRWLK